MLRLKLGENTVDLALKGWIAGRRGKWQVQSSRRFGICRQQSDIPGIVWGELQSLRKQPAMRPFPDDLGENVERREPAAGMRELDLCVSRLMRTSIASRACAIRASAAFVKERRLLASSGRNPASRKACPISSCQSCEGMIWT